MSAPARYGADFVVVVVEDERVVFGLSHRGQVPHVVEAGHGDGGDFGGCEGEIFQVYFPDVDACGFVERDVAEAAVELEKSVGVELVDVAPVAVFSSEVVAPRTARHADYAGVEPFVFVGAAEHEVEVPVVVDTEEVELCWCRFSDFFFAFGDFVGEVAHVERDGVSACFVDSYRAFALPFDVAVGCADGACAVGVAGVAGVFVVVLRGACDAKLCACFNVDHGVPAVFSAQIGQGLCSRSADEVEFANERSTPVEVVGVDLGVVAAGWFGIPHIAAVLHDFECCPVNVFVAPHGVVVGFEEAVHPARSADEAGVDAVFAWRIEFTFWAVIVDFAVAIFDVDGAVAHVDVEALYVKRDDVRVFRLDVSSKCRCQTEVHGVKFAFVYADFTYDGVKFGVCKGVSRAADTNCSAVVAGGVDFECASDDVRANTDGFVANGEFAAVGPVEDGRCFVGFIGRKHQVGSVFDGDGSRLESADCDFVQVAFAAHADERQSGQGVYDFMFHKF